MSRLKSALCLGAILTVFIIAGLAILPIPFTRDQGIYAYNGWQWLAGAVPYRDTFGHKGPLLYLVYAVGLNLSGGAMWGPNLLDLIARTATIIFTALAGMTLAGRRAGTYGAFFTALPLLGIFNSCWWNAQAETFMLPLLAASVWLALRSGFGHRPLSAALSGLFVTQAAMLKPNAMLHCLFLFFWLLTRKDDKNVGRSAAFYAIGSIAGAVPWVLYFIYKGALLDAYEFLVTFNSIHLDSAANVFGLENLKLFVDRMWVIFYLIPLMAVITFFRREWTAVRSPLFILWWVLISLIEIVMQARFFLYHFLLLVPPLGVAAGAGMDAVTGWLARFRGKTAAVLSALICIWFTFTFGKSWYLITDSYRTRDYLEGKISLAEYYARFSEEDAKGQGDFNLLASAAAAYHLRQRVPEGGTVLVFGYEPLVNYLAARPAPTRFEIDYPLTFKPLSEQAAQYREKWREQFMEEIRENPPDVVVLVDNDINALEPSPSIVQAGLFEPFWTWLNKNYEPAGAIEDFLFYERKKP